MTRITWFDIIGEVGNSICRFLYRRKELNKYLNNNLEFKQDNGQIFHYEITDINRTLSEIHGEKYIEYRREWDLASDLKSYRIPLYLVLETNSYCNMKCSMCIRNFDNSKNRPVNASLDNISKILREGKEMGIPSFFIGAEAECLINPDIKKIIRMVKEEGGGIDNFIITNGYELNDEIINLLIDLQWERIYISLDAAKPETYKKIRGMDLTHVETNILRLLELREKRGSMLPLVRVSFVIQDANRDEIKEFTDKWKDKVDIIDFQKLIHYEDMEIKSDIYDVNYQCAYPFRTMLIDCDGVIYPCCTEYGYKMPIGNIESMGIEEAWNSEKMKALRSSMLNGDLCAICRNCAAKIEASEVG